MQSSLSLEGVKIKRPFKTITFAFETTIHHKGISQLLFDVQVLKVGVVVVVVSIPESLQEQLQFHIDSAFPAPRLLYDHHG